MAKYNDADIKAEIANIRLNHSLKGMRNDFKKAVARLFPTDPAKGKKKRGNTDASASGAVIARPTAGQGG